MSYQFYLVLHLVGIFAVILALGGVLLHSMQSGSSQHAQRGWLMMFHGTGILITLVAGFGLIAKTSVQTPWPGWLWCKLLIWFYFAFSTLLVHRLPGFGKVFWLVTWALAGTAAYLAILKPF